MIKLTIPGQPQGKGRAKVTVRGKYAHAYTPEKTANYENLIKVSYINAYNRITPTDKPLRVLITAFCYIPKSFSRIKREKAINGELRPTTKPDIDNIAKVVADALNKVAYADDKQIIEMQLLKYYSEQPRLEIEIGEIE